MRKYCIVLFCLLIIISSASCVFKTAPDIPEPEPLGTEWPKDSLPAGLPGLVTENGELAASAYDDIVRVDLTMNSGEFFDYTEELTAAGYEGELIRVDTLPANCAFADIDLEKDLDPVPVDCTLDTIKTIDEDAGWNAAYYAKKDENYILIFRERDRCVLMSRPQPVTVADFYMQEWY
jgi:hypothetical protein